MNPLSTRTTPTDSCTEGDSYQFVIDVWRHADPELEPYLREARAGLNRLMAET